VPKTICCLLSLVFLAAAAFSQEAPKSPVNKDQPQVRINYLNVCTPSTDEQQEIRKALASVPSAKFAPDFEISRGQTSVPESPLANYVRVRHEFMAAAPFIAAQYSLSADPKSIVEDLVFRTRDPKDVIEIQLEDTITGAHDPKAVLATDTPVDRIKLERFGKQSVVLSRCPSVDQSAYQPLFSQASELMAKYRTALGTKRLVPRELAALAVGMPRKPTPKKPAEPSVKK
jgi:hypothetical protein